MPRQKNAIPSYLLHKVSGREPQARVRIAGKEFLLGRYGSEESRIRYGELIARFASGVPVDPLAGKSNRGTNRGTASDDPNGSTIDISRFHRDADRVFRGQGNSAGRQRLRSDGTLRAVKPPRGLILSTGEDVPSGQSLRARLFIIEMSRGDIPSDRLTVAQHDADAGLYVATMAAFLKWLAPNYAERRIEFREAVVQRRDELNAAGLHARTPGIVADLEIALGWFLDLAQSVAAIDAEQQQELIERCHRALSEVTDAQQQHQQVHDPAEQFVRLLAALLASGRAHVANIDGQMPGGSNRAPQWGWENCQMPHGRLIGWIDEYRDADGRDSSRDEFYLEPDAAYAEVKRLADEQGQSLPVTQSTLWKRLNERGHLASVDDSRSRLIIRKVIDGTRRAVIHLRHDVLSASETVPSVPSVPMPCNSP